MGSTFLALLSNYSFPFRFVPCLTTLKLVAACVSYAQGFGGQICFYRISSPRSAANELGPYLQILTHNIIVWVSENGIGFNIINNSRNLYFLMLIVQHRYSPDVQHFQYFRSGSWLFTLASTLFLTLANVQQFYISYSIPFAWVSWVSSTFHYITSS